MGFQPSALRPSSYALPFCRIDGRDPLRMGEREPESDRRAVVEHVDRESRQSDGGGEGVHRFGQLIESRAFRRVGKAEPGKIGRDHMVAVREQRNEVAEHVQNQGRESVQQEQRWSFGITGFAIEDGGAVGDGETISEQSWDTSKGVRFYLAICNDARQASLPCQPLIR